VPANEQDGKRRRARLTVRRSEAKQKIDARIEEGRKIQELPIHSKPELNAARDRYYKWSEYNVELLHRLFDTSEMAEEYDASVHPIVFVGATSFWEEVKEFRNDVAELCRRLESIRDRLELIPEPTAEEVTEKRRVSRTAPAGRRVFVVHGHDEGARAEVCRLLERLDLEPVVLHEQANAGRTIIEKFEEYAECSYTVVLLTPDDVGYPGGKPDEKQPRARQNVILELGYFLGKLGRQRVCVLYKEDVEMPSDYQGVLYVSLERDDWQWKLAREMKKSGMDLDVNKLL